MLGLLHIKRSLLLAIRGPDRSDFDSATAHEEGKHKAG